MKINKITFTGADDNTNYQDLLNIQNEFPLVEWGILFSGSRKGTEKYPTQEWIDNLPGELNLSAHFCGKYSREVIEKLNFEEVEKVRNKFKRIQLNYSFKESWLDTLVMIRNYSDDNKVNFIFQYNKGNKEELDMLMEMSSSEHMNHINFLYDASGGRGIEIKEIKAPFEYYTGYSGGINPDNISTIVSLIENFQNPYEVYIDMEAGVRSDGKFDLTKVRDVLQKYSNREVKQIG